MDIIFSTFLLLAVHFFISAGIGMGIGLLTDWIYKKITGFNLEINTDYPVCVFWFMFFIGLPYIEYHIMTILY